MCSLKWIPAPSDQEKICYQGLGAAMDVLDVSRGRSSSSIIQEITKNHTAQQTDVARSTSTSEDAAVVIEFGASPTTQRATGYTSSDAQPFDTYRAGSEGAIDEESQQYHKQNAALLATLSPGAQRKYQRLIGSVIDDHEQLKDFIHGVSKVLKVISKIARELAPERPVDLGGSEDASKKALETPLVVGNSVTFSLSAHLDATLASAKAGNVSVKQFALDISFSFSATKEAASNTNDSIELLARGALTAQNDDRFSSNGKASDTEDTSTALLRSKPTTLTV